MARPAVARGWLEMIADPVRRVQQEQQPEQQEQQRHGRYQPPGGANDKMGGKQSSQSTGYSSMGRVQLWHG